MTQSGHFGRDDEKGACRSCGRTIGLVVPRGGDGSLWVLRRHITTEPFPGVLGVRCDGSGTAPR